MTQKPAALIVAHGQPSEPAPAAAEIAFLAAKVQSGELSYTDAVKAGMYTPLGTGDVDIAGIVSVLRDNGFNGWFVMEQDTILDGAPDGDGPLADVRASVAYLNSVTG